MFIGRRCAGEDRGRDHSVDEGRVVNVEVHRVRQISDSSVHDCLQTRKDTKRKADEHTKKPQAKPLLDAVGKSRIKVGAGKEIKSKKLLCSQLAL